MRHRSITPVLRAGKKNSHAATLAFASWIPDGSGSGDKASGNNYLQVDESMYNLSAGAWIFAMRLMRRCRPALLFSVGSAHPPADGLEARRNTRPSIPSARQPSTQIAGGQRGGVAFTLRAAVQLMRSQLMWMLLGRLFLQRLLRLFLSLLLPLLVLRLLFPALLLRLPLLVARGRQLLLLLLLPRPLLLLLLLRLRLRRRRTGPRQGRGRGRGGRRVLRLDLVAVLLAFVPLCLVSW
mmetsp:Transcript_24965/g.80638  ORF Transcript_24965/g.80638 Transcript_24965/m.80638 type:complete len:238 (+) Transcript_24965:30-743(+)